MSENPVHIRRLRSAYFCTNRQEASFAPFAVRFAVSSKSAAHRIGSGLPWNIPTMDSIAKPTAEVNRNIFAAGSFTRHFLFAVCMVGFVKSAKQKQKKRKAEKTAKSKKSEKSGCLPEKRQPFAGKREKEKKERRKNKGKLRAKSKKQRVWN